MFFAEQNENATMIDMLVPGPNIVLSLELVFARYISHWKKMAPGKYGDRKIVASFYYNYRQQSFVFFLKKPFYLEISNA